ncbi:MAG: bifunctional 4-hydroxy-3-methylbut-2-enyl diphosphate reductase/30S ribosomal protein S1 [Oscillospiraceae bacterium]|nr:bifunctional 4-hydroxy-3-methylbut-2-enyl diphosphate reductase/30S ribosomal protein S1 [Oscillospiraceae bacterium]
MKKLFVSESAGFCFGVSRSVQLAEELLQNSEKPCYCLGELIHNDAVVSKLRNDGLIVVHSAQEIPRESSVIIRSHGVAKNEYDILAERNCEIIDASCPKVKKIHNIVAEASKNGRIPVVIGEKHHPEVVAICGWCESAEVFADANEFKKWLDKSNNNRDEPLTLVFQTTQTQNNLEEIKNILKKECTNCEYFDTICSATSIRQFDAAALSKMCGAMVVIGARHSANSVHLAEICRQHCNSVQFISSANELNLAAFDGIQTIGITAGASTPAWIIKEVKQTMTDEMKIEETTAAEETEKETDPEVEMSFDQMLEESIKTIYNGDTVKCIVAAITPTEISVDLGTKHSGYIPVSEFTDDTDVPIEDLVKIGDTIEAVVVRVNDVEGTVMLSKKRLEAAKSWIILEEAVEKGTILEGTVTEDNKGGVVVTIKGIRVFVPASQTGLGKEAEMSELLKKKVRLKVTEVNRARRRVVGSIRAVSKDERRERSDKIWSDIEVGKHFKGIVKSLTGYGVFVDIGGIDGMIHVSELSWSRVKQPSDVMNVGDEVDVRIISFDKENHKISLGYKDPNGNPWERFMNTYHVDDVVNVKIVKLMPFGAFAEVMPGVDGLIHISQISSHRIGKPEEVLSVGEAVDVKITAVDTDKQKISLSIRALLEPEKKPESENAEPVSEESALVYEVSSTGEATGVAPEAEEAK